MKIKHIIPIFACLTLVSACNEDNDIVDDSEYAPKIILDNEDGVYTVKVGGTLTISPEYENSENTEIVWTMDDAVVCRDRSWTSQWNELGEFYVTITASNRYGKASEDIRVDVLELTPPVISLALPEGGLKVTAGTDYIFMPDIQHSDGPEFKIEWYVNGKLEGNERQFTFNRQETSIYTVKIVASNEDGTSEKQFEIEVVSGADAAQAFFHAPSYFITSTTRYTFANRPVFLSPVVEGIESLSYSWSVDGVPTDETGSYYKFVPVQPGEYLVSVTVTASGTPAAARKAVTRNISRSAAISAIAQVKVVCVDKDEAETKREASATSSAYENKVYEYLPAPGQFVDEAGPLTSVDAANEWAQARLEKQNTVSLGAWGGYIIMGFDHSITASGDYDFAIKGNAFNSEMGASNEPGIVYVMQDVNGNGLPDDEWYQLKGSEYDNKATLNATYCTYYRPAAPGMNVEWTDADGQRGQITFLTDFYPASRVYYPGWVGASSYRLYGALIPANNHYDTETGFWFNKAYGWGYADNTGTDQLESESSGGSEVNGFKISNAVYADGTPAGLKYIDFVKVQTGTQAQSGNLGENSTEIFSVYDLSIKNR